MQKLSNQYAAMPSLHCAWAGWCTFVLWPAVRRPWAKALVVAYPFITVFAIVVTANHYFLDAVGGAVVLAIGYVIGSFITNRTWPRALPAPEDTAVDTNARAQSPTLRTDDTRTGS